MVITVVGLGFVGLTAALGFCKAGHTVLAIETDENRRRQIANGRLPFFEPGMLELLHTYLGNRLLVRADQDGETVRADAIFYCVGTPCGEGGSADLTILLAAVEKTLSLLDGSTRPLLVIKSTVPPRTLLDVVTPFVEESMAHKGEHASVLLANNPEFLREGKSLEDFLQADRVVVGSQSQEAFELLQRIYEPFGAPIRYVSPTTAEFIKYLSNTFLATMISYANEMAHVAHILKDIDVADAFSVLLEDHRWNSGQMRTYAYPGCGYGGYCLPKDTVAMQYCAHAGGADTPLLDAVIRTNSTVVDDVCDRILSTDRIRSVGVLGLSFKPETDDVRDSPAARIIFELMARGVERILAYDPLAETAFQSAYPHLRIEYPGSAQAVIDGTERQAIVTAWAEFAEFLDIETLIDCRYMAHGTAT